MGSSPVAFKYFFFFHFSFDLLISLSLFLILCTPGYLFEFGMRLCNKYSTVNNFKKPSCD